MWRTWAAEVRGNIVLFESKFAQRLASNGEAGADYRLPHTGLTIWKDKQAPNPAAALAAEDADMVARLDASGPVMTKLLLTPQTLPDADSYNVIADWPGREKTRE